MELDELEFSHKGNGSGRRQGFSMFVNWTKASTRRMRVLKALEAHMTQRRHIPITLSVTEFEKRVDENGRITQPPPA